MATKRKRRKTEDSCECCSRLYRSRVFLNRLISVPHFKEWRGTVALRISNLVTGMPQVKIPENVYTSVKTPDLQNYM
jgi:hypothetical protein